MYEPIIYEGIFIDYDSQDDLLYKEIYSNRPSDIAFIKLYHKGKFVSMAYVWHDGDYEGGREYIEINHEVVYLDTIKTLIQPNTLINHICDKYNVTFEELQDDCKKRKFTEPRNILYYILRKEYGITYEAIGDMFFRTHATVINGVNKISGYMEVGDRYRKQIEALILTKVHEPACLNNEV